jgi:hypothetical protein
MPPVWTAATHLLLQSTGSQPATGWQLQPPLDEQMHE